MKKFIYFTMGLGLGLMVAHKSYGMEPEQSGLKPIMPQQQLLAQKDALEGLVKNVWENCLKALDAKLPGLTEQNDALDKLIIRYDFEKLPKTDANILLIKKTVQDVITKTPILFIQFDKASKGVQEQALKWILERMMGSALGELLLKDKSESLDWCTCKDEHKRITLALLLVNEAREKFPNKNQRIVHTSFGPGGLLQDYIIVSELLESHTNVLVNLIDLSYPEIPALAKKNFNAEDPRNLHMLNIKNQQEEAAIIDSFKTKIAQIISVKESVKVDYNFEVNIYQNAYEYIARIQKNPNEKSNILILVDPGAGSFAVSAFPSLANVINIWVDQEKAPIFTLYLPRHHGVQLYEIIKLMFSNKSLTVSSEVMQYVRNQLLSLIVQTGANKNYTPRLIWEFLDRALLDEKITDEALARIGFPRLMQLRSNVKKGALENKYRYLAADLLHEVTPIKLGDVPVLLSWASDAHISFQDLVWGVLAPNAIVYQLDSDFITEEDLIVKLDPERYKKSDVISSHTGGESAKVFEIQEDEAQEEEPQEEQIEAGLYKRIL